jgi:hypothetical protein
MAKSLLWSCVKQNMNNPPSHAFFSDRELRSSVVDEVHVLEQAPPPPPLKPQIATSLPSSCVHRLVNAKLGSHTQTTHLLRRGLSFYFQSRYVHKCRGISPTTQMNLAN